MNRPHPLTKVNESGQAQVLSLVVLFLLLAVAAGLVDIIYLTSDRRQVQWLADAAARAAVSQVVRAEARKPEVPRGR